MTPMDSQPELLRADEAAAFCGVAKRTWWRLVANSRAPEPIRLGGAVRWRRRELVLWVNRGCRNGRSQSHRLHSSRRGAVAK